MMKFGLREIAFVALLLAIPIAAWAFVFRPQNAVNAKLDEETEAMQHNLRAVNKATATIDDLKKEIAEISEAMTYFKSKLPSEKEMDKVLKEIWKLAEANRLKFKSIRPKKEDKKLRYTPPDGPYAEQPMEVVLEGDFMGVYAFLQALENQPRITRVRQLHIQVPHKSAWRSTKSQRGSGAVSSTTDRKPPGYVEVDFIMSIFFERNKPARNAKDVKCRPKIST
jgi:Tfp pilus assembly protein PilO